MGNTPSSVELPARRPTHKLSKPRTGNHATTAGLLSPSGFSNSSRHLASSNARLSTQFSPLPLPLTPHSDESSAPPTTAAPSEGTATSEGNAQRRASLAASGGFEKEARRKSLFRSKSSQGPKSGRRKSLITSSANASRTLVRANSVAHEPRPPIPGPGYRGSVVVEPYWSQAVGPRGSWTYDMTSYEAKRLVNLAEETTMEEHAAMEENKMTVVSESTWKSSHPPQSASTPITRANSDLSLYTPVRRRSIIQTPGVATRSSTTLSRPTFRFSHPPTPNLSRQPSIESYRDGVISMPPLTIPPLSVHDDTMPRVVTPCEDGYLSIGAFKLGSLRITNGAASPVSPEIEKAVLVKAEARSSLEAFAAPEVDYFDREKPEQVDQEPAQTEEPTEGMKVQAPKPRPARLSSTSSIANSLLDVGVDSKSSDDPGPSAEEARKREATEAPLAFLAEIEIISPLKLDMPSPTSPALQITSKHTVHDDNLFEDDGQMEYSSPEVLDVRLDPNAKSRPGTAKGDELPKKVMRTDSGFESESSPSSEVPHKTLSKADSGYSSNVSLRSFSSKVRSVADEMPALSLEKQGSLKSQGSKSTSSDDNVASSPEVIAVPAVPQREAPAPPRPPPVPPKDAPAHLSIPRMSVILRRSLSSAQLSSTTQSTSLGESPRSKHVPSPISSGLSVERPPLSPDSFPRTPGSAKSTKSEVSASALSIGTGSHNKLSKLQRLLSSARRPLSGPLTVHTTHASDKVTVPAIPQELETKFHEHAGLFPMTTKRLALKPRTSKDTLKTIFSVGSFEVNLDAASGLLGGAINDADGSSASATAPDLRRMDSTTSRASSEGSNFLIPRKPVPVRQNSVKEKENRVGNAVENESIVPVEAELTSYNSITTSLGNNAYDAALRAISTERRSSSVRTPGDRTMSLTASVERRLSLVVPPTTMANLSPTNLPSPSLPSPLLAREMMLLQKKAKTPPPVSMMTRRPTSLRVPPLLRPQSAAGRINGGSASQRRSRESIHGYPSRQKSPWSEDEPPPPIPPLNPRRSLTVQTPHHPHGDVLSGPRTSGPSSSAGSTDVLRRRTSLPATYHAGQGISRPGSAQSWREQQHQQPSQVQMLRHRASYDGSNRRSIPQSHNYAPSYAPPHAPPPHPGYVTPSKPLYDPRSSYHQWGTPLDSWDQFSRYPQPVPRGGGHHYRNRSVGSRDSYAGPIPPYRVLHSYNSPAYRNVPIWG